MLMPTLGYIRSTKHGMKSVTFNYQGKDYPENARSPRNSGPTQFECGLAGGLKTGSPGMEAVRSPSS